tara:strand:+ start:802 stop:2028 length:1227 start_codon:yes stop_codon:yes gene_type:complete
MLIPYISSFLVGFSYSFLLYNKIAFGISMILGTVLLMIHKKSFTLRVFEHKKELNLVLVFLIISFFISCVLSIKIERSVPVIIYFFIFLLLSSNLSRCFNLDEKIFKRTLFFLSISAIINLLYVLIYNLYHSGILTGDFFEINFSDTEGEFFLYEIKKFKGYMNIFSVLVLLIPFFRNSLNYFVLILFLLPTLILSNSNSPILGIILGLVLCGFLFLYKKTKKPRIFVSGVFILFIILASLIVKNLPSKLESESLMNYDFKIPISIIDAHRQFVWAFSITQIKEKPLFGFGPDTSNFIEGSQEIIGNYYTGTMEFMPSHPHNFIFELILEIGIFGTLIFFIFLILINIRIFKKCNMKQKYVLIFFNGYFWGASLVNFSFWLEWWQGSYFFILAIIYSKINFDKLKDNS